MGKKILNCRKSRQFRPPNTKWVQLTDVSQNSKRQRDEDWLNVRQQKFLTVMETSCCSLNEDSKGRDDRTEERIRMLARCPLLWSRLDLYSPYQDWKWSPIVQDRVHASREMATDAAAAVNAVHHLPPMGGHRRKQWTATQWKHCRAFGHSQA